MATCLQMPVWKKNINIRGMSGLHAHFDRSNHQIPTTNPNQNTGTLIPANGANRLPKRYFSSFNAIIFPCQTPLANRICRIHISTPLNQVNDNSPSNRQQLGGKGMFLRRMQEASLPVPPFRSVTAQTTNALEQHLLDTLRIAPYCPDIVDELGPETSLKNIREYFNALPPSEQTKRDNGLAGLAKFIASHDFYEQVKDSEAARHVRGLRCQLDGPFISQPVIVRSSGINEDNYGNAQAGKYLSEVQGEEDVFRTCLKVMASGYRPEVCPEGIPQPMALIIQHCIDCQYGGVAMSFQSFQDDSVRIEYTPGQPRGAVAGQSGNTPHRIDISRKKEGADSSQYFPGTVASHFILRKNTDNRGYSETRIHDAGTQSDDTSQQLSDDTVSALREMVAKLEDLLLCPVDVEFAIDRQGRLFLLQVRPVTELSGGMDFAMPIPEDSLATGETFSEGYGTGPIWLAKKREAGSMPHGAIVVARHAEQWMLEPDVLMRAGGFVIAEGGFNDHVAILMRQEKKPLMLAAGEYAAVVAQDGRQITLACARFDGNFGAFIVDGDHTGKLASHRRLSSAFSDISLAKAAPSRDELSPPEGTLRQVASGFKWLTEQNARLLALYSPGGGLDCLANPVKLSMSPQRSNLLAQTKDRVNLLIHGAEALLEGYRAFLLLAGSRRAPRVERLLDELPQLINRFETLKQTIRSGLEVVILPLDGSEKGQVSFRQWVVACQQLQSCLQMLNPSEAEQVRSVHELIFALHQRFVKALAPVTLAAGQGRLTREEEVAYVDCTTPGGSGESAILLSPSCKASLKELDRPATVVSMDGALIVNLKLGSHMGLIELLEDAEGGKGRTLRLTFSDEFDLIDGIDAPGKLKRMWFLVQLLKAIELDKYAAGMKLSCNAVAGEIIVECPRVTSRQTMQDAFEKLITALHSIENMDIYLEDCTIFEGDLWDFNLLEQRLNRGVTTEVDRFAFQHCLFATIYDFFTIIPDCWQLLSKQHQQFIHYVQQLEECWKKPEEYFRKVLMSDEISEDTRRELLHHLLLLDAQSAIPLVDDVYPDLRDQYYVIKPSSYSYRLEFDVSPGQSLSEDKEKVRNFFLKNGLKYACQKARNDKNLVLAIIAVHPDNLKYVSEELKSNKEVVLAAVAQEGNLLEYASLGMKDNDEVVMAAIANYPGAFEYASHRIRSDKNMIKILIADDFTHLRYAGLRVFYDREYMLDLIEENPQAFEYAAYRLQEDQDFIDSAIQRNSEVVKYIPK
ncbi:PEP/pyruvate-binding domain-containing protein [Endozoicomonas sp. SESOKO2]|uniref:PEP/pyruvate-binding domain-containing protein n=3 Tax=unclassified Endozoicomonas TaxID=2644528 RepID=UPI0021475616|nr:PEP/pyruvate-binding domain-containing protein [Endozoicomonas sp. SESOKO2]